MRLRRYLFARKTKINGNKGRCVSLTEEMKLALKKKACQVRMGVIESTHGAKAGHPGGSLSAADLFAYLYNRELRIDPKNPKDPKRDRFVLSKGHTAPGLYAALAYRGFFPVEDLPTLRHIDSYLQGHPNMNTVPGVDMSTGSLGQGISAAAGMAKGAKEGYTTLDVPNYKQVETLKETYTDEELLRLLKKPAPDCNFCEYRNWVIINFLLNSGCRAATVRNILIGDVFLPDSQIIFRHTKTHKVQVVPLAQMNANAERLQKGSSRR